MRKQVACAVLFALLLGYLGGRDARADAVLYVSGGVLTDAIRAYFAGEGVEVDVNCAYSDATDAQRIILARQDVPDVFVLDVNDGYWGLVQKGYLEPVDDPELTGAVGALYPAIRSVLMDQAGQIVAMPEYFMPIHWCANETVWAQIFGDRPYPETFLELAELLSLWQEELAEEYPEYKLLEFAGDSHTLILEVIRQYIAQFESAGKPVVFEDSTLINTLEKLRSLDLQPITEATEDEYLNQQPLLTMRPMGGFGVEYMDGCRYVPILPPRLTGDSPAYVPARMRVMVVNPHTKNRALAYAYVKQHWEGQTAAVRAAMTQGWNRPVYTQSGLAQLQEIEQDIEYAQEQLSEAVAQEAFDREDVLRAQMRALNEKRERVLRTAFDVSEEDIAAYSAIGPHVELLFGSPYASEDDPAMQSIVRIIRQFSDGRMTGEQCARRLEEIAQKVAQENAAR